MTSIAMIAATLAGCYPLDSKFTLAIDSQFASQERCLIAEASRRWGAVTGGVVDVSFSTGASTVYLWEQDHHVIFRGTGADADRQHRTPGALGWTHIYPGGAMWLYTDRMRAMYPDRYAPVFLYCAMHELGHHLGLGHLGDHTLMAGDDDGDGVSDNWSWDERGEPCVTQTDVDAFCALYSCNVIAPPCGLEVPASEICD